MDRPAQRNFFNLPLRGLAPWPEINQRKTPGQARANPGDRYLPRTVYDPAAGAAGALALALITLASCDFFRATRLGWTTRLAAA